MSTAKYDVVVFGATSFVGQILCRYLYQRHGASGESLRWALAGRNPAKLAHVRQELGADADALPLIAADAADSAALRQMCEQTKVVISTVGPYALYGDPLVQVCVETGTDYCDLTGETQWIARMLERHEAQAKASGARIVHCCGFDSIPSDLGVAYTQQQMAERHGGPARQIKMRVKAMRGTFSGGTVASMIQATREVLASPETRKLLQNPYALCPPDARPALRQPNVSGAQYDEHAQRWVAPFVMAAINTRVVHRSNALLAHRWGQDFLYDEAMMTGAGVRGRMAALGMTGGLAAFFAGAALPPTRWLMEKTVLPAPGEGPSPQAQENGYWDYRFYALGGEGQTLTTRVTGDRDPGYGSTAKMLGEAGACLAQDVGSEIGGGFWTPASALGDGLRARLETHAGLRFEVLE